MRFGFISKTRTIAAITLHTAVLLMMIDAAAHASSVTINSPANGATVSGVVNVQTTLGAGVWWAHLLVDGALYASTPPDNFTWDSTSAPNGTHTLELDGFASGGSTPLARATVSVTVNNSGAGRATGSGVTISSPPNNANVSGVVTVQTTLGSNIWWAHLLVDGALYANTPPNNFTWNSTSVPNGKHDLHVDGYPQGSSSPAGSYDITVNVQNSSGGGSGGSSSGSGVTINSPANNANVSGVVTVQTTLGSNIWWARLLVDGVWYANTPPNNFTWNSTSVSNGQHNLEVIGYPQGGSSPAGTYQVTVNVQNSGSGKVSHFYTLAPGATLPSESWCASNIASTPETVSQNTAANHLIPSSDYGTFYTEPFWFTYGPSSTYTPYTNKVDGNYTGSTDMILRWAACKWGIDEDVVRAEAWVESGWIQGSAYPDANFDGWGDFRNVLSLCQTPAWNGWNSSIGGCYQTCGILQSKVDSFNVWPAACESTSFNADFRMAMQRACMDGAGESWYASETPSSGYPDYPDSNTDDMLWGCMGAWYSSNWYDAGALSYIADVQSALASRPWP